MIEEGEPETIFERDDPEHHEFVKKVAEEHGFPLSDWKPKIPMPDKPSALNGLIFKLRRGEQLSDAAIDELDRLLMRLRNEGWSGFITADEALKILIDR